MGILNIETATRQGAHLLIQLFGGPRSGKTLTALKLARGIAGPKGRVGVLDTESGRARLYSDKIAGGFLVGELTPPFTPARYRLAIEEFIAHGIDVLVIDSFSHIWEGPGGVLEQADNAEKAGLKGLLKWKEPKVEYKKTVNFLLTTKLHVILCSRGKQPMVEEMVNGKKTYKTLPWEPIQDKRLKYEMTVVLPMTIDGEFETERTRLKTPGDLAHLFTGTPLSEATGAAIIEWLGGAMPINPAHELLRKRAADAAADGVESFRAFWKGINGDDRAVLKPQMENLQSVALAADAEKEAERIAAEQARRDAAGDLEDPFGAGGVTSIAQVGEAATQESQEEPPAPDFTPPPSPLKAPKGKADWSPWVSWVLATVPMMSPMQRSKFMTDHVAELDWIGTNRRADMQAIDEMLDGLR